MLSMNFRRNMFSPVENAAPGIARYVSRYSAVVSEVGMIYRK